MRRFILHYAALCKAAGGVDSFCICVRDARPDADPRVVDGFPAVVQLRALAVRGPRKISGAGNTKIGYAADWSEYFGYQPQ